MGICNSRNRNEKNPNSKIQLLQSKNDRLSFQLKKLSKKYMENEKRLIHIDYILSSHEIVAESILESKINCEWLDNKQECEYLIDVVKFIHVACNDLSCGRLSISLE